MDNIKHFWLLTSCNDRYKTLLENDFKYGDGYDYLRNATFNVIDVVHSPINFMLYFKSNINNSGKIVEFTVNRIVPKIVTKRLVDNNKPYRCPCWFIFVKYENGSHSAYHITKVGIKI